MNEFKFIDCNQAADKLNDENYLFVDIRDKDSKKHIMDQYLDIFENNLDEIQENLDNIVYFDPTPQN